MCGRYVLTAPGEALAELFGLDAAPPLTPRYNIAPTQPVPVVRQTADRRELATVRWGLIPHWAKDAKLGARLINARWRGLSPGPAARTGCVAPVPGRCPLG